MSPKDGLRVFMASNVLHPGDPNVTGRHGFSGRTSDFGFETSSCGFCGCGRTDWLVGAVVEVITCPAGRAGCRCIVSGCGGTDRASAAGGEGLFCGEDAAATASSCDRAGVGAAPLRLGDCPSSARRACESCDDATTCPRPTRAATAGQSTRRRFTGTSRSDGRDTPSTV